jgi:hypothetical protein
MSWSAALKRSRQVRSGSVMIPARWDSPGACAATLYQGDVPSVVRSHSSIVFEGRLAVIHPRLRDNMHGARHRESPARNPTVRVPSGETDHA